MSKSARGKDYYFRAAPMLPRGAPIFDTIAVCGRCGQRRRVAGLEHGYRCFNCWCEDDQKNYQEEKDNVDR